MFGLNNNMNCKIAYMSYVDLILVKHVARRMLRCSLHTLLLIKIKFRCENARIVLSTVYCSPWFCNSLV